MATYSYATSLIMYSTSSRLLVQIRRASRNYELQLEILSKAIDSARKAAEVTIWKTYHLKTLRQVNRQ